MTDARATIEPGWPAMSLAEIEEALCAPGQKFEMEEIVIRGVATRVWKNLPPSLGALASAVAAFGDRELIVLDDERVTYDAWFRATATLAHHLDGLGIGKGDRVAIAMRNLPEWVVAFYAIVSLGAIAVPLNAWWTAGELVYGLTDSGSRLLICDAERCERLRGESANLPALERIIVARAEAPLPQRAERLEDIIGRPADWPSLPVLELPVADVAPDDDATILYTSGTTGDPKGAVGTHRATMSNILSAGYASARTMLRRGEIPPAEAESKCLLLVIPLFHVTGLCAVLLGIMATGSKLVMMRKWDPIDAFRLIEAERVSIAGGVPTIAWQLLEHPDRDKYDLSSLESVSYGGAPSAPELVRLIKARFGAAPGNGWGMTETSGTVTQHSAEDYLARPDSAGPPVAVAELRIMALDGSREMPLGEVGELWSKGPQMARCYWNKPGETAECYTDGWVHTGDLARLDGEGFLYIVDRAKDMVIRGGENIYSIEVENVLYDHPAVIDAALIGLPHRTLGEEPAAVVQRAPGEAATEAELQDWVRARLAAFKAPVRIAFVDEPLPRNANGKILKKELREMFFGDGVEA